MQRRRYLTLVGVTGGALLYGCLEHSTTNRNPDDIVITLPPTERAVKDSAALQKEANRPSTALSGSHPVLFLSPDETKAIAARIADKRDPWWSAFRALKRSADGALSAVPRSVVDNGAPHGAGDNPHLYGSDAPYQEADGEFSAAANREDYEAATSMSTWIRDLSLAYALTGTDAYAEKAIDLLHHWFVDSKTRMEPSGTNYGPHTEGLAKQNSIEHYITIPKMLYGASFLGGHDHWKAVGPDGKARFTEWVSVFLDDLESTGYNNPIRNNIYAWWVLTRASAAAFLGDLSAMDRAFEDWRTVALDQLDEQGSLQYERQRSRGLFYSLYGLEALISTAELARHYGVNLYEYQKFGRSAIQSICDFHGPYVLDPTSWPYEETDGFSSPELREGASSFELAYSKWQKEEYFEVISTVGRPISGSRILGSDTLTHGNLFEITNGI